MSAPQMPPLEQHQGLMEGFTRRRMKTAGAEINVAIGGEGPPLLLIHGNPLTHVSWHKVAPTLAKSFTIIAPDLRGYGDSSKPDGGPDHINYTFRAMGEDFFQIMTELGHEKFQIAGHDRGARVGFRMALDQPGRVLRLAALDIVPTFNVLNKVSLGWGLESYHWYFMAQKAPFPEDLLSRDTDYYINYKLNKKNVGLEIFSPAAMAEYKRVTTREQIHGVCEDYRATIVQDFPMDAAQHGKDKLQCPVMVIWGSNSHCGRHFKVMRDWGEWADDLVGFDIPTGHYPAEHRPDMVYPLLWQFFSGQKPQRPEGA